MTQHHDDNLGSIAMTELLAEVAARAPAITAAPSPPTPADPSRAFAASWDAAHRRVVGEAEATQGPAPAASAPPAPGVVAASWDAASRRIGGGAP